MPRSGKVHRVPPGHVFSKAPQANAPRSRFNRSHGVKTTFDAGYLVPIYVDEMLPGDTFNVKLHAFVRMSTPIFPIMDNLYLDTHFFAVPYRLVWEHWEAFNGARTGPSDTTTADTYTVPQMSASTVAQGSLGDYMGLPTKISTIQFNSLHFRAYNLIYNTWFKDENLIDDVHMDIDDGPDTLSNYVLLRRGKRHDYFTSCLPWPQKNGPGNNPVTLPLGGTAPLQATGTLQLIDLAGAAVARNVNGIVTTNVLDLSGPALTDNFQMSYYGGMEADLSGATAATINDIRLAFQTQKLYERDARGGTRYTEIIRSHFGVISPDSRLQRPEYLGGGSAPVMINPVAQTTPATTPTETNALGNLAAYGVAAPRGHGFVYSAQEHMLLIGLVSVRSDYNYMQGMNRMWSRQTRLDYYWPAFSHLGEQAVLSQEIYADGTGDDQNVFGYQERWAEYRYKPSLITGLFRANATGSLDAWHLAQDFGSTRPTLGATFIQENPPMSRVLAVSDEPNFLFDGQFVISAARPMPVYSVPGLVDHF